MRIRRKLAATTLGAALLAIGIIGCDGSSGGDSGAGGQASQQTADGITGSIMIDGSSTVEPVMSAFAEEFGKIYGEAHAIVGTSGTGGGFKKFCGAETDISNASRPIKKSEVQACTAKSIEFIEIPIAFDGLSVVANPQNTWANNLTVAELKKIWEPNSKVDSWDDVRPGFPNVPITLYGPGTDSGTFDYFTEAIMGKSGASRSDYQASEDDNTLVQGVSGDKGALGYFGYAYYDANKSKLKLVSIGGVAPNAETISNGTYSPLSRPLIIYVRKESATKPQVAAFVKYALTEGSPIIRETGYIPLPEDVYKMAMERFEKAQTGTVFASAKPGMTIQEVMTMEKGG